MSVKVSVSNDCFRTSGYCEGGIAYNICMDIILILYINNLKILS